MSGTNPADEIIVRLDNPDGTFIVVSVSWFARDHNLMIGDDTSLVMRVGAAELVHMRMDRIAWLVRASGE